MRMRRALMPAIFSLWALLGSGAPGLCGDKTIPAVPDDPHDRRPTVCAEQYLPVCGRLGDTAKTYPNACYARAAGAVVIADGPCSERTAPSPSKRL